MNLREALNHTEGYWGDGWSPELEEALEALRAHARRELEAEAAEEAASPDNIFIAVHLVREIDEVRAVQRELRSAFARSELDGGAKAAPRHPLYIEAEERLAELHDQLMLVI